MVPPLHPREALFPGEPPFPTLPVCEHYAGSEKYIGKALALQQRLGPLFDITFDCEDGAPSGREAAHAGMIASWLNSRENRFGRCGARIHDPGHPHWRQDVEIIVGKAGARLAYLTIPKVLESGQVEEVCALVDNVARMNGLERPIPLHALIETHGGLHNVWKIAAHPRVEVLDFGLMDFVSSHHGAIPANCMRSPGQFDHALVARAKCEIVTAAIANGCIPAHNVTLDVSAGSTAGTDAGIARERFGFLRMWSIHPAQIEPIIAGMRPDGDELADAVSIITLAMKAHWGPIRYRDELYDRASYRYYWAMLLNAHTTGLELPETITSLIEN